MTAGPTESASSLEWNLENPTLTGWGDDPGEDPLTQSPPFNGSLYPNYDPAYDGWVWEMIYEFKVPESAYSGCSSPPTFTLPEIIGGDGTVGGLHSSPGKTAEGAYLQGAGSQGAVWLVE